jgi:hypothetical protein
VTLVRAAYFLVVLLLLSGCSGPPLPFAKDQPAEGKQADMVRPPWEALVKAGPGAANDLDMETLDGPNAVQRPPENVPPPENTQNPAGVAGQGSQAAAAEAPAKTEEKAGAAISAVAVPALSGPGGAELTLAMRKVLGDAGWPVVKTPAKTALTIKGQVKLSPARETADGSVQTATLQWVVLTPDGKVLGDVKQSNDVPAGSLDKGWGENAQFAAEGAAEGIFKLIERFR